MSIIHKKLEFVFAGLTAWVYHWKYPALAAMFALTLALGSQTGKLTIDTRDESFFHDDDPTLIAYNNFRDTFGQDDIFIIGMKPRDGLSCDFFAAMSRFHHELENSVPHLDEITSLINARVVWAHGDNLVVEDLMEKLPQTDEDLKRIMDLIDHYPLYENLLVTADRTIACLLVKAQAFLSVPEDDLLSGFDKDGSQPAGMRPNYLSNEQNVEINDAIHHVAAKYQDQGIDFYFAGTPAFVAEIQRGIEKDLRQMIPLSFLIIIFFLILLFRRISGVVYPLLIVAFSLISSLGIMALAAIPITNAISILPTFLIVVGVADSVHILTIFYRNHRRLNDKRQAIIDAVGYAGLPVLLTSLTTACGLFSFTWADVAIIAQLGYVAPVGVMLAFSYTVVLLPAMIAAFPVKALNSRTAGQQPVTDRIFGTISRITTRRPVIVAVVSSVVLAGAGYSAFAVRFSHNALTWLPENSSIRVSTKMLDRINGGTVTLEATVDSGTENGLHDPDLLHRMSEAADHLTSLQAHGIRAGKAWSLADMLKEMNRALHQDEDDFYKVPDRRELIAQELLLFESSGSDDLEEMTDSAMQIGRLSMLAPFTDAILYKDFVDKVKTYLERQFPAETVTVTGHMALFVQMIKHFITSMAKSYGIALIIITLFVVLVIGRFNIAVMSMIANVAPIICIFGIMGILHIPVDLATILIGSLVLGIVVDDTIHILHHFRKAFDETSDVEAAVRETLSSTGRALVITSIVLCGGFFTYTTSYLASNIRFGLLSGFGVLFALAADFFLVPALLSLVYGRRVSVLRGTIQEKA